MDGDSLRSVRPGDSIDIEAATWNSVMESARAFRGGRLDVKGGGGHTARPGVLEVIVYNVTGADVPSGSYLAYLPPLNFTSGDVNGEFVARPYVTGYIPRTTEDDFVVLIEPIASYDYGRAIMAGPFMNPSIQVGTGEYLRAIPGDTTKLQQCQRGRARMYSTSNVPAIMAVLGAPSDRSIYAKLTARAGSQYAFSQVDGNDAIVTGGTTGTTTVGAAFDIEGAADNALVGATVLLWPYKASASIYPSDNTTWAFGPYKKVVADIVPASPGPGLTVSYRWCIGSPLSATTSTFSPSAAAV